MEETTPAAHNHSRSPALTQAETHEKSSGNDHTSPPRRKPLHYVSNLRSSLTALVVLHHAAISYGGIGSGIYTHAHHAPASSTALVGFNAFNQTFFMGTFMFLGGHFSRRALARKPPGQFVWDRLYRLGLPTLTYTLVGQPLCYAIVKLARSEEWNRQMLFEYWRSLRGPRGPSWFTGTLLAFDLFLVALNAFSSAATRGHQPETKKSQSSLARPGFEELADSSQVSSVSRTALLSALTCLCTTTFLVRLKYPCGAIMSNFRLLGLNLAYAPQYVAAYILGARIDDIQSAQPSPAALRAVRVLAASSSALLLYLAITSPSFLEDVGGGWSLAALGYAIWNEVTGYVLGSQLLRWFGGSASARYKSQPSLSTENQQTSMQPKDESTWSFFNSDWGWINATAYSAFLVHYPMLALVGVATDQWKASGLVKTVVLGGVSVVGSWSVGFALDRAWASFTKLLS